MLILKTNRNFLNTEAYKVAQASARNTSEILEEGIKSGEFRSDMQPYLARAMIWGTIEHLVIRKSLLGKPEDLLSLADEITNTIFQGILAPRKETALNVHVTMGQKK
jgi:TetR/AcrR family fatty acid metabolism transcriptional regulator